MIDVAAGVLTDVHGRVLLMRRLPGTHLAGTWEFPGGKRKTGETIEQALARELREELGIEARAFAPLISLPWIYPEKTIRLHALRVPRWHGEPRAREGHPLRWSRIGDIDAAAMPPADRPILAALRLPPLYAITPSDADPAELPARIGVAFGSADTLLQLRLAGIDRNALCKAVQSLLASVPAIERRLLINGDIELARELGVGAHLRAAQLFELNQRALPCDVWMGASCHNLKELDRAAEIGADFATLSPIHATASHPHAPPLGWRRFARLVADAQLPVYALGGVGPDDLARAWAAGAQGVAGISGFFPVS